MSLVLCANLLLVHHRNFPMSVYNSRELREGYKKSSNPLFVFVFVVCISISIYICLPISIISIFWWMFVSAENCESRAKTCFCYKLKHKASWTGLLHFSQLRERLKNWKNTNWVGIKLHSGDCPGLYLCICIFVFVWTNTHKLIL